MTNSPGQQSFADVILELLDLLDVTLKRVILGMFRFLSERLFPWLKDFLEKSIRIVWKLAKVGALLLCWIAIVFGPIVFARSIHWSISVLSVSWMLLSLVGSTWAFMHYKLPDRFRRRSIPQTPVIAQIIQSNAAAPSAPPPEDAVLQILSFPPSVLTEKKP